MPNFHHHPDNLIFVRTKNGTYTDTPDNFAADLGDNYQFNGHERYYEPRVRHFVDNNPQPLQWADGDRYITAIDNLLAAKHLRENPPPTFDEAKESAQETVMSITGQLISKLYPPEKQEIYRQKQLDIMAWKLGGSLPNSVVFEWEHDWAGRLNTNGYVLAEGPGVMLKCRTANDLFNVWRVNAAFVDYIRVQMEPLRTRSQADVQAATDEATMADIVSKFATALDALPLMFIAEELPGLLTEYGLQTE